MRYEDTTWRVTDANRKEGEMIKTFSNHPPHATEEESSGPPNAEVRGVRYILRNSLVLAVAAMVAVGVYYLV